MEVFSFAMTEVFSFSMTEVFSFSMTEVFSFAMTALFLVIICGKIRKFQFTECIYDHAVQNTKYIVRLRVVENGEMRGFEDVQCIRARRFVKKSQTYDVCYLSRSG